MNVIAGTDTYGRVKTIGGIPIVTKFVMLQVFPIYPLESFYYFGTGETKTTGVPFIAGSESTAIHGIPLARVDLKSVAIAYVRAIFATIVILGSIATFGLLVMYLTDGHLNKHARNSMNWLILSLVIGVGGGLLTYAIPLTSSREKRIRNYCGELLRICIDPARVSVVTAKTTEQYAELVPLEQMPDQSRFELLQQLIITRSKIAQKIDVKAMERQTDELLKRLDSLKQK